jgi:threonine/homoserine/homoserine lactone efflux protein
MTHHSIQGIVGLIGLIYLCLTGLPFLTSRGVAEQQPDTTVSDLIDALKDQDPVIRQGVATDLSQILSGGVVSPIRGVIRRPKRRTVRLE